MRTTPNSLHPYVTIFKHSLGLCSVAIVLSACATLNKDACLEGDWAGLGYKDGAAGYEASTRMARHNKACSKHDITINAETYLQNHTRGLRVFCTKANGYDYALDDGNYTGNCPEDLHSNFVQGYLSGLEVALDRLQQKIDSLNRDKQNRESQLVVLQSKLVPDQATIDSVQEEIDSLNSQVDYETLRRNDLRARMDKWKFN